MSCTNDREPRRKQPGWKALRSIPLLGVMRVVQLLAIVATPHRFRTKRNLWPYAGLAVVTRSSADQELIDGKLGRRDRTCLRMVAGASAGFSPGATYGGSATSATLASLFTTCST
jgi:transposase